MEISACAVLKDKVGVVLSSKHIMQCHDILTTLHVLKHFNFFLQCAMQVVSELVVRDHLDSDLLFIATVNPYTLNSSYQDILRRRLLFQ